MNHLEEQKPLEVESKRFNEGRRTEDNIMIIKTLFESYVKKKKQKLFMAFVDFRKFFDTINRKICFTKCLSVVSHLSHFKEGKPPMEKRH